MIFGEVNSLSLMIGSLFQLAISILKKLLAIANYAIFPLIPITTAPIWTAMNFLFTALLVQRRPLVAAQNLVNNRVVVDPLIQIKDQNHLKNGITILCNFF